MSLRVLGHATEPATGRWAVLYAAHAHRLPPDPVSLPLHRMPSPPVLSPDVPLRQLAFDVARAYAGALRVHYPRAKNPAEGGIDAFCLGRAYMPCVVAAQTFLAEQIAPGSWCAFSVDRWRRATNSWARKGGAPSVAWVLAPSRLTERREWYEEERLKWTGGRLLVSDLRRDYARRWGLMRAKILSGAQDSEALIERSVQIAFGSVALARRLAQRIELAEATRALELKKMAQSFEFIW